MGLPAYGNVGRGLTAAEMADEVQALTGTTDTDEPLATESRITRWLNESQRIIVKKCAGIESLTFKNTTSFDMTSLYEFDINDITGGDFTTQDIAHVWDVWYLDGNESAQLTFLPTDEFDSQYPDPTHSDIPVSFPKHWTRRAGQIEILPMSACAYWDSDLRFDGDFYPRDLSADSTEVCDISMSTDTGLIIYATAQYYAAAGKPIEARIWEKRWSNDDPKNEEEQGWLEDFIEANNVMHEWNGNLYWPE